MDVAIPALRPDRSKRPDLTVVAALIVRDSKILVCQRRRDDTHSLLWEFPGGKMEAGETPQQALLRELREELGVESTIGRELFRARHIFSDSSRELQLIFFQAHVDKAAVLQNLVFEGFEWSEFSALPKYDFLRADKEFVALLAAQAIALDAPS
jgi:8-oxo-dGTP diphosphatase